MMPRIILPLLTGIAVLATCLEGRYHLEATGLRHHRHDRHHKVWDQELVVRGSRRRAWEENHDEERYVPRERFELQRRWRNRVEERRDSKRDRYFRGDSRRPGSHATSGRTWGFRNPVEPYGGKWRQDEDAEDYEVRDRRRGRGRGWVYEDEDEGYESDDEEFYPPRRAPKPRKNRHEARRHRVEDEDEEYYEYDDEYEDDYEDYDLQDTDPRPPPRHRGRKHEPRGKKGSKLLLTHEEDDVNEVEKRDEDEDEEEDEEDIWGENEDEDYDETVDESVEAGVEDSSTIKAIDEVIRSLKAKPPPTTPRSVTRRDYRNVETERYVPRGRSHPHPYSRPYNREAVKPSPKQPHRTAHKRTPVGNPGGYISTATTTTTSTLPKYTNELSAPMKNSSFGKMAKGRNKTSGITDQSTEHPGIDSRTKNIEQDYEEYENDGSDDKPEDVDDADGDADKKWTSEKDQDYADEENEDETERPTLPSSTTTTSTLPPTTTTTTTIKPTPPPVHTRPFDHRQSRLSDARARSSGLTNVQTTSTEYPPMSNYSAYKWDTLGSRKAVSESRRTPNRHSNPDISKAIDHVRMMNKEGTCRLPRPRVVSVRDVYPSPSKTYKPHCTMLHRCADDTGCCASDTTCVPKHIDTIELSFYASVIDGRTQVEKLKFENHTECECRPRSDPRLRDTGQEPPSNIQKPKKSCKCPTHFAPKITPEGECDCTCPDNLLVCVRLRRGKDYFSVQDRWCIQNDICTLPPCDFGEYMRKQGRCPHKTEIFFRPNYYSKRHADNGYQSH
ncbi:myb-like protein X [Diprion similis]|uniref:myb-like protein X n=1 Tax=Diprion similis TaxID=362088 RepID=UPI001EF7972D|nr:myb-like protein X [Diprion similis]